MRPKSGLDSTGYGYTDYGADGVHRHLYQQGNTTFDNGNWRLAGGLHGGGSSASDIIDGLSKTIAMAEDVGRNEFMPGAYPDPLGTNIPNASNRAFWRWIEPDNGFGVNGPPTYFAPSVNDVATAATRFINNNSLPYGGPTDCIWNAKTHCGPNDEIFSFHGAGANVVFMDGHVTFLSQDIERHGAAVPGQRDRKGQPEHGGLLVHCGRFDWNEIARGREKALACLRLRMVQDRVPLRSFLQRDPS